MNKIFPSLPEPVAMGELFAKFPNTARPLCEYHDRLLRDWSPLTVGQRELIAAYVSGLNACTYCFGAHSLAARAFGIDEAVFDALMGDLQTAPVNEQLKPVLAYVRKLTLNPTTVSGEDAAAVYEAGWDERALFDAISVCALYNFMNRIVEGAGMRSDPLAGTEEEKQERMRTLSGSETGSRQDAHEAPPQYTALLKRWGVE